MIINVEKVLNHLRDQAENLAHAKSELEYLSQFRKSKKALLMAEAESKGINVVSKQEVYAYKHEEYLELLDGLKEAVFNYEKLKHLQVAAQLKFDAWRSLEASNRREFTNYGN